MAITLYPSDRCGSSAFAVGMLRDTPPQKKKNTETRKQNAAPNEVHACLSSIVAFFKKIRNTSSHILESLDSPACSRRRTKSTAS